ncbi:ABC transporter ATP-binding protein [Promicromonospora kroppenstedtii]|uniref:ABC transporter ATP-binding protein n=1 Tax=Promicromonospora kroppenstedtii TaxID=440482 RepID=A0ABW7XPF8_9MICO
MTTTSSYAIEARGLVKEFRGARGTVRAVDGLDLVVRPGEVVAFLGPNGAGKTTTVDLVLGLAAPTAGTVRVLGKEPARAIADGQVAAVMQTGGLLRDITVGESVELTAALFGRTSPAGPFLERAGIADLADRTVGRCSGGQQQRLRFAMALVSEPDLLLLDEPTAGMDVRGRRDFWTAIRHDAEAGRTVVFATHYLQEAESYADRVVLISQGRLVADGTVAEVRALAGSGSLEDVFLDLTAEPAADPSARTTAEGGTR